MCKNPFEIASKMIKHKLLLPAQFYTASWNNQATTRKLINESKDQPRQDRGSSDWSQWATGKGEVAQKQNVNKGCAMVANQGSWAQELESFSTSAHAETKPGKTQLTSWVEDGTEGPERPWELEYSGQRNREENFAEKEKSRCLQKVPVRYAARNWSVGVCEETAWKWTWVSCKC